MGLSKGGRTNSEFKKDNELVQQARVNTVLESMKARQAALEGQNPL
jgi:hypothetical protein